MSPSQAQKNNIQFIVFICVFEFNIIVHIFSAILFHFTDFILNAS